MKTRQLGRSALEVSILCLGGNVFGWTADEQTSFALLDAFVEAGGNFIDTADVYSRWVAGHQGGESERIIGRWMKLRNNRAQIHVATKVGIEMGPDKKGLRKEYICKAVEDSLQRLQTDFIDLYISHRTDESTPIQETLEAYDRLIRQGKVRVCGASNYSGEALNEAANTALKSNLPTYQSLQPLYNLYDRFEFETDLRPVCQERQIGVTPYYALASGFLTGKYRSEKDLDKSPRGARARQYLNERGLRILTALDQIAKEYSTTPAVTALAWLMNQPTVTSAIASASSVTQLRDLVRAASLNLSAEAVEVLSRASAP